MKIGLMRFSTIHALGKNKMSDSYKRNQDGEPVREQYFRSARKRGSTSKFKRKHKHSQEMEGLPLQPDNDFWPKMKVNQ